MMTLYCDESDDGETYALAGWLATPSAWRQFEPAWRAMLETIKMPDGSPCAAFHTREIVNRDLIPGSRFKGWTFQDERACRSPKPVRPPIHFRRVTPRESESTVPSPPVSGPVNRGHER